MKKIILLGSKPTFDLTLNTLEKKFKEKIFYLVWLQVKRNLSLIIHLNRNIKLWNKL